MLYTAHSSTYNVTKYIPRYAYIDPRGLYSATYHVYTRYRNSEPDTARDFFFFFGLRTETATARSTALAKLYHETAEFCYVRAKNTFAREIPYLQPEPDDVSRVVPEPDGVSRVVL